MRSLLAKAVGRRLGHLEIGPTDHFEGISASYPKGQVRAEMTWHIIAVTQNRGGKRVGGATVWFVNK